MKQSELKALSRFAARLYGPNFEVVDLEDARLAGWAAPRFALPKGSKLSLAAVERCVVGAGNWEAEGRRLTVEWERPSGEVEVLVVEVESAREVQINDFEDLVAYVLAIAAEGGEDLGGTIDQVEYDVALNDPSALFISGGRGASGPAYEGEGLSYSDGPSLSQVQFLAIAAAVEHWRALMLARPDGGARAEALRGAFELGFQAGRRLEQAEEPKRHSAANNQKAYRKNSAVSAAKYRVLADWGNMLLADQAWSHVPKTREGLDEIMTLAWPQRPCKDILNKEEPYGHLYLAQKVFPILEQKYGLRFPD